MENLFDHLKRITLKDSLELKMEAENGEWGENELLELMYRYQRYHSIVEEQAYVIRGSVLSCEYGTREVRMDCTEDHGVYVGIAPLMTCGDCQHTNIHEFGSCMCPESNYAGRLPMTPGFFMDGSTAEKALGNNQAHICRPLINLEQGWRQIDEDLLVESHAHMTEPALLSSAVLVCNYGGIIRVREVPEKEETTEEETLEEYIKEIMTTLGWTANDDEVSEIKEILEAFGITDRISIACFLLLCISETGAEGLYSGKVDRNGRKSQLACLQYLKAMGYYQGEIDENALGYTEELREMPWQSAAWRWAVVDQTAEHSLNAYTAARAQDNGDKLTLGMVLTAECFINGWVSSEKNPPVQVSAVPNRNYEKINDALGNIARGYVSAALEAGGKSYNWYTKGEFLYVGGWRYRAPNNWPYFMENYYRLFSNEKRNCIDEGK